MGEYRSCMKTFAKCMHDADKKSNTSYPMASSFGKIIDLGTNCRGGACGISKNLSIWLPLFLAASKRKDVNTTLVAGLQSTTLGLVPIYLIP